MSDRCAPQHTYKEFTATGSSGALTVAGGGSVHVYGIVFQAVTANVFTITDAADNTLFKYSVAENTSDEVSTYWIADAGIKVQSGQTDGSCVVFHNAPGR